MKTNLLVLLTLVLILALSVFGSQTTVTGVLTDNMCTKKHMMPGKPSADCVRDCIKHGAKYVVVADGKIREVTGKQGDFEALAGRKVRLTGEPKGKTFTAVSIEAVQ